MSLFALFIISIILGFGSIAIWESFPLKVREFLSAWPVITLGLNLGMSFLILTFTGTAQLVGVANLGGSILLGIWILIFRRKHRIQGLEIKVSKLWKVIALPSISVKKH